MENPNYLVTEGVDSINNQNINTVITSLEKLLLLTKTSAASISSFFLQNDNQLRYLLLLLQKQDPTPSATGLICLNKPELGSLIFQILGNIGFSNVALKKKISSLGGMEIMIDVLKIHIERKSKSSTNIITPQKSPVASPQKNGTDDAFNEKELVLWGIFALCNQVYDLENQNRFVTMNGLELIFDFLNHYSKSADIICNCFFILQSISMNKENSLQIFKKGGVPLIIALFSLYSRTHLDSPQLLKELVCVLKNLSLEKDTIRDQFILHGNAQALSCAISILQHFYEKIDQQTKSFQAQLLNQSPNSQIKAHQTILPLDEQQARSIQYDILLVHETLRFVHNVVSSPQMHAKLFGPANQSEATQKDPSPSQKKKCTGEQLVDIIMNLVSSQREILGLFFEAAEIISGNSNQTPQGLSQLILEILFSIIVTISGTEKFLKYFVKRKGIEFFVQLLTTLNAFTMKNVSFQHMIQNLSPQIAAQKTQFSVPTCLKLIEKLLVMLSKVIGTDAELELLFFSSGGFNTVLEIMRSYSSEEDIIKSCIFLLHLCLTSDLSSIPEVLTSEQHITLVKTCSMVVKALQKHYGQKDEVLNNEFGEILFMLYGAQKAQQALHPVATSSSPRKSPTKSKSPKKQRIVEQEQQEANHEDEENEEKNEDEYKEEDSGSEKTKSIQSPRKSQNSSSGSDLQVNSAKNQEKAASTSSPANLISPKRPENTSVSILSPGMKMTKVKFFKRANEVNNVNLRDLDSPVRHRPAKTIIKPLKDGHFTFLCENNLKKPLTNSIFGSPRSNYSMDESTGNSSSASNRFVIKAIYSKNDSQRDIDYERYKRIISTIMCRILTSMEHILNGEWLEKVASFLARQKAKEKFMNYASFTEFNPLFQENVARYPLLMYQNCYCGNIDLDKREIVKRKGKSYADIKEFFCIEMPHVTNGSLLHEIEKKKQKSTSYTVLDVIQMALQILRGLKVLFSCGVLHKNLRSSNIMVLPSNLEQESRGVGGAKNLLLSDFGFESPTILNNSQKTDPKAFQNAYISPEVVVNGHYSAKSDLYSFGFILLEILTMNSEPFNNGHYSYDLLVKDEEGFYTQIGNMIANSQVFSLEQNEEVRLQWITFFQHIILNCVQKDPSRRITFDVLLYNFENLLFSKPTFVTGIPQKPSYMPQIMLTSQEEEEVAEAYPQISSGHHSRTPSLHDENLLVNVPAVVNVSPSPQQTSGDTSPRREMKSPQRRSHSRTPSMSQQDLADFNPNPKNSEQLKELESANNGLSEKLQEQEFTIVGLKQQLDQVSSHKTSLESALEKYHAKMKDFETELEKMKNTNSSLQKEKEDMSKDVHQMKEFMKQQQDPKIFERLLKTVLDNQKELSETSKKSYLEQQQRFAEQTNNFFTEIQSSTIQNLYQQVSTLFESKMDAFSSKIASTFKQENSEERLALESLLSVQKNSFSSEIQDTFQKTSGTIISQLSTQVNDVFSQQDTRVKSLQQGMTNNWDTINPLLKEITNRLSMIEKRHEESLTNHASVRTQLSNHQETVHQVQDQLKQLIETGIDPLRKNWDSVGPTLKELLSSVATFQKNIQYKAPEPVVEKPAPTEVASPTSPRPAPTSPSAPAPVVPAPTSPQPQLSIATNKGLPTDKKK